MEALIVIGLFMVAMAIETIRQMVEHHKTVKLIKNGGKEWKH